MSYSTISRLRNETPSRCACWGASVSSAAGEPVDVHSGGKTAALLELQGLAPRQGVARETLPFRLWPDSEAPLTGNALNNLVHALRGLLDDALGGASPIVHTAG